MRNRIVIAGIAIVMVMSLSAKVRGDDISVRLAANRADTKATISVKDKVTTIDIVSSFGIDNATLQRTGERWPDSMVISLHLKGLESLEVVSSAATLLISIPSTGEPLPRVSLRENGIETAIDKTSPYWTDVRIVGGNGRIPLEKGHFEIPLPAKLFEGNPASVQFRWIDFYRN